MRAWARAGQAPGQPLLSPVGRRRAATLALACVIVTAGLGAAFAGHAGPSAVDRWADGPIISGLDGIPHVGVVARLGTLDLVVPICAIAVIASAAFRRYRPALLVIITVPVVIGLTEDVLKPLIDRTYTGSLTYPSGHTAVVTTMAAAAVVVLTGPARPALSARARRLLVTGILAVIPVVAVALVVIHFHYLTDTIGGAGLGAAVVLVTALALDAAAAWLARRAPAAQPGIAEPGIAEPARELPRA